MDSLTDGIAAARRLLPTFGSDDPSTPLVHPTTANGALDSSGLPSSPPPGLPTPEEILADPERKQLSDPKNEVKVEALSGGLVVKRGKGLRVELVTIEWMREHSRGEDGEALIPTPKYKGFYTQDGVDYLFISKVEGESFESLWPSLSPSDRHSILSQFASILRTLRSFTAPFLGRLNETQSYQLPFRPSAALRSWDEYHRALRASAPIDSARWEDGGDLAGLLRAPTNKDAPLGVLTHGDLAPRNLLVCPRSKRIVALVDWECLEFGPPELEYLRSQREVEKGWSKVDEAARAMLEVVREVTDVEEVERHWEWYKEMVM
ncbi:hypothetical protein JCM10207_000687 [Rhodosporidiobolus poonsookiae]